MKRGLTVLAATAAIGLCSSAALAENRSGAITLAPAIGAYHFNESQHIIPNIKSLDQSLVVGLNAGYNLTDRISLEGLFHYVRTTQEMSKIGVSSNLDVFDYRLEALYSLFPQSSFVPHLAAGWGGETYSVDSKTGYGSSSTGIFSYGLGAKYFLTDDMALRADMRQLVHLNGHTAYNFETTVGLHFQFGGVNKPAEPVVAPKKAEPAPPPPAAVPKQAPVAAPLPPTAKLSVAPASIKQNDAATLNWSSENSSDCAIQPAVGAVQPSGSTTVSPKESTTYKLTCTGKGGSADSSANVEVLLDSDNDGVIDKLDKCPGTPAGTEVDKDGCPVKVCKSINLSVTFDTNSATVKPAFNDELKQVADQLKAFPKATAVIEGHTDSVGSAKANLKLSQRRADAVRKFIIEKHGIDAKRVTAKGFGLTKPIDTNKTAEGRKNNRRVVAEFTCP
jgi:OOP family OmpA-OmpF porin